MSVDAKGLEAARAAYRDKTLPVHPIVPANHDDALAAAVEAYLAATSPAGDLVPLDGKSMDWAASMSVVRNSRLPIAVINDLEAMHAQALRYQSTGVTVTLPANEAKKHAIELEQCAIFAADAGPSIAKAMTDAASWLRAALTAQERPEELDATDLQTLLRLQRDNVWDGARPVLERPRSDPEVERAFALSDRGLIALEQVAQGIRLHITRKGVAAVDAALASAQERG